MPITVEIIHRFAAPKPCDKILYAPLGHDAQYQSSKCYHIDYEGSEEALKSFIDRVLGDPISEELHYGEKPALSNYHCYLDVGLKANTLDLEKEHILSYFNELDNPGFTLTDLSIAQRYYIFSNESVATERFVKDLVNPVIHNWELKHA